MNNQNVDKNLRKNVKKSIQLIETIENYVNFDSTLENQIILKFHEKKGMS